VALGDVAEPALSSGCRAHRFWRGARGTTDGSNAIIGDMAESFTIEQDESGRVLVVRGDWTPDAERLIERGRVDGLRLNYALGYRERSLDFLRAWPLRSIEILARTVDDLSPVYRLAGTLKELHVTTSPRARIDLALLPHLSSLSASWEQVHETFLASSSLRNIFLLGYTEPDLYPIAQLRLLESLRLKEIGGLRSLDGVERMPHLTQLHPIGARHLTDIDALAACPTIENLWMEASLRSVGRLDPIQSLVRLRFLEIGDCGGFDSIGPLAGLSQLQSLYAWGTTNVADGDLSVLTELPELKTLRMMNRRHYRPSVKDVMLSRGMCE
jgi:hypothetical protein